MSVRTLLVVFAATASLALAESHPAWWSWASPEATALVGIRWDAVKQSPFAGAIGAELSGSGLGLPDLNCLHRAQRLLISSPALLAVASGDFPAAALQQEAADKGFKRELYRNVVLYLPASEQALGVAQIDEHIILMAARKTLESAIDRSASDSRLYSPLLANAARYAQSGDLWVVARHLPDPLANVFVPIDSPALGFEGSVNLQNGLDVEASFDTVSPEVAQAMAEGLRQAAPSLPAIARDLKVTADGIRVVIALEASAARLNAELREGEGSAPAVPAPAPEPPKPAEPPKPVEPPKPQVIRIFGLDEGVREIPFPPKP